MGYSTAFEGQFNFSRSLTETERNILKEFTDKTHDVAIMPSTWCQWVSNENGTALVWDGGEKFNTYIEWLHYLIKNYFEQWGIKLDGEVNWYGDESADKGIITIKDNYMTIKALYK
ncbi:hypothetical protein [Xanthocytophaga agilis]|uniref:Uncharacterized protein n=1 Tax=Xanthocytophaga agilis TaxID=3048010 RepID=A0AAE3RBI8_9BACT|nr:hypothetical protein [Xanthocytophaga agilis]MDJ1505212.1 hypothetical protein [Xanthocytophaga agilis]